MSRVEHSHHQLHLTVLICIKLMLFPVKSYPVQRVCVECIAGLLPFWVSLRLETDLTDGKDVALLFSFTMTHLQNANQAFLLNSKPSLSERKGQRHPAAVNIIQVICSFLYQRGLYLPRLQGNGSQTPGSVLQPVLSLQQQSWVLTQFQAVKRNRVRIILMLIFSWLLTFYTHRQNHQV